MVFRIIFGSSLSNRFFTFFFGASQRLLILCSKVLSRLILCGEREGGLHGICGVSFARRHFNVGGKDAYATYDKEESGPSSHWKISRVDLSSNVGLMDSARQIGLWSSKTLVLDKALNFQTINPFRRTTSIVPIMRCWMAS